MTVPKVLAAATAEYLEASRQLVEHPLITAAALRFWLARKTLKAQARQQLGSKALTIISRILFEAAGPDRWSARAEGVYQAKWAKLFSGR